MSPRRPRPAEDPPKRGRGRPPLDPDGSVEVRVRLTREQADWLEHQAARADESVAAIVRRCVERCRRED